MLGTAVVDVLTGGADVVGVDVGEFDISDDDATADAVATIRPDVVVNCAAYTDVDGAETERGLAFAVNARGAGNIARAAEAVGAPVLHISTDYVFDGAKPGPYLENDTPCPVNAYGESKLGGEREIRRSGAAHLIVRTAWLYGHAGGNFVETMLRLAGERERLSVVDDQLGAPTNVKDLALILKELIATGATGVVNATNGGSCTWYRFARRIIEGAGFEGVEVMPVGSSAFPRPAKRPANSVLSLAKLTALLGWAPRRWEEALAEYLSER